MTTQKKTPKKTKPCRFIRMGHGVLDVPNCSTPSNAQADRMGLADVLWTCDQCGSIWKYTFWRKYSKTQQVWILHSVGSVQKG